MTRNNEIKKRVLPNRLNKESDFSAGKSSDRINSTIMRNELGKNRLTRHSYIIARAYDEPYNCCMVENILLQRDYIID